MCKKKTKKNAQKMKRERKKRETSWVAPFPLGTVSSS